jgi:hypothetical protein
MASPEQAGGTPTGAHQSGFRRDAAVTRSLLGYGVVVGPFYLVVGLAQALLRDGFDLKRHPLSVLANGSWGWVQTVNFVLSGLMVLAAAVGFQRVLGPKSRAMCWFLGGFGVSMLVASVFRADPVDGFPAGTPVGPPTSISTSGMIHLIAGVLGFTFLGVSCFLGARAMARRNAVVPARLSVLAGLSVLLGFFGGAAFANGSFGVLGIWYSVLVGWSWLAAMSIHLYRASPDPNCAPRAA